MKRQEVVQIMVDLDITPASTIPRYDELVRRMVVLADLVAAKEREALCDVDWTALLRESGVVTWGDASELGERVRTQIRARGAE